MNFGKDASRVPFRRRRLVAAVVGALAAVTVLAACSSGGAGGGGTAASGQQQYASGGTFTIDIGSDPGTLSPYQSTSYQRQIYLFMYDTLVTRNSSGTLVPELAKSWKTTPDSVTFTLNSGVTCQDGSTLTASDVAQDFNYIKNPSAPSPWLDLSMPVSYSVSSDNAANTVTLTTAKPFGLLANGAGLLPIACPNVLKNPNNYQHASDGTGPYRISSYVPDESYTLTATPGYKWGPDGATNSYPGAPKTIVLGFTSDQTTAANDLVSGQIDAAQVTGPDQIRLNKTSGVTAHDVPVMQAELMANEAPGRILADEQVRLAVAHALNRTSLASVATDGLGSVATNMMAEVPQACPGNETSNSSPAFSPSQAESILNADGWTLGGNGIREKDGKELSLTLIYLAGNAQTDSTVELIGQELKTVGIGTTLQGLTEAAFANAEYTTLDFDLNLSGINLEYPYMYTGYFSGPNPLQDGGSGRNSWSTNNPTFTSLSAQALTASGPQACTDWTGAHEALIKSADVIPIATASRTFYTRNSTLSTVGLFAVPTSIRLYQ